MGFFFPHLETLFSFRWNERAELSAYFFTTTSSTLFSFRWNERAELSAYFFTTTSSEAILPSRMKMMRCACCAMSCSCVTRMIVFP